MEVESYTEYDLRLCLVMLSSSLGVLSFGTLAWALNGLRVGLSRVRTR